MNSIEYQANKLAVEKNPGVAVRLAKKIIHSMLAKLNRGFLVIEDDGEFYEFGNTADRGIFSAHIKVHNPHAYWQVLVGGTIGTGEAYMSGWWTANNLTSVVRIFVANQQHMNNMETPLSRVGKFFHSSWSRLRPNTLSGAKRNIGAHYDLSNDFFSLFLDKTMMYSSAIYSEHADTLETAAVNKLDHICQRLQLKPGEHLLEIGTGWGGFAAYAAEHYGCHVTTTTISDEQYAYAKQIIRERGLQDRITLLKKDYRLLEGQYDKLVSIEMIEAVGHKYFKEYFSKLSQLVKPDGLLLIQAITNQDQRFEREKNNTDFIRRYIFPGGCLPSQAAILDSTAKYTDLALVGQEDITLHYARTLADWRERFFSEIEKVRELGYSETFIRMWDFYLCYCEGGFAERVIGTSQLLFAKPRCRSLPII